MRAIRSIRYIQAHAFSPIAVQMQVCAGGTRMVDPASIELSVQQLPHNDEQRHKICEQLHQRGGLRFKRTQALGRSGLGHNLLPIVELGSLPVGSLLVHTNIRTNAAADRRAKEPDGLRVIGVSRSLSVYQKTRKDEFEQ